jgi:hypothetical protein
MELTPLERAIEQAHTVAFNVAAMLVLLNILDQVNDNAKAMDDLSLPPSIRVQARLQHRASQAFFLAHIAETRTGQDVSA